MFEVFGPGAFYMPLYGGWGGGEGRRLVFQPEHGSTHPGDSLQINRSARLAAPPLPRSKAGRENVSESKRFPLYSQQRDCHVSQSWPAAN